MACVVFGGLLLEDGASISLPGSLHIAPVPMRINRPLRTDSIPRKVMVRNLEALLLHGTAASVAPYIAAVTRGDMGRAQAIAQAIARKPSDNDAHEVRLSALASGILAALKGGATLVVCVGSLKGYMEGLDNDTALAVCKELQHDLVSSVILSVINEQLLQERVCPGYPAATALLFAEQTESKQACAAERIHLPGVMDTVHMALFSGRNTSVKSAISFVKSTSSCMDFLREHVLRRPFSFLFLVLSRELGILDFRRAYDRFDLELADARPLADHATRCLRNKLLDLDFEETSLGFLPPDGQLFYVLLCWDHALYQRLLPTVQRALRLADRSAQEKPLLQEVIPPQVASVESPVQVPQLQPLPSLASQPAIPATSPVDLPLVPAAAHVRVAQEALSPSARIAAAFEPGLREAILTNIPGKSALSIAIGIVRAKARSLDPTTLFMSDFLAELGFVRNELTRGLFAGGDFLEEHGAMGVSNVSFVSGYLRQLWRGVPLSRPLLGDGLQHGATQAVKIERMVDGQPHSRDVTVLFHQIERGGGYSTFVTDVLQGQLPQLQPGLIRLYHGTTIFGAHSILNDGIDVTVFNPDSDFGPAFYATQDMLCALHYMNLAMAASSHQFDGGLLVLDVDRNSLNALANVTDLAVNHVKWATLVRICRSQRPIAAMGNAEWAQEFTASEIVSGPIVANANDLIGTGNIAQEPEEAGPPWIQDAFREPGGVQAINALHPNSIVQLAYVVRVRRL
eukprot:m.77349 g.77349  ORF g.77349 m.77349 type:complete len:741 (-) comp14694_c0_seq1:750-2972(-)